MTDQTTNLQQSDAKPHLIIRPPDLAGLEKYGGFGNAADICETAVIVSAPYQKLEKGQKGRVYIYNRTGNDQLKTPTPFTPPWKDEDKMGGGFGDVVAISDKIALVSAPYHNTTAGLGAGIVFVYEKDSSGNWAYSNEIRIPRHMDIDHFDCYFGASIAVSGDTIVIGGENRKSGQSFVAIYEKQANHDWAKPVILFQPDQVPVTRFGEKIALNQETLLVRANEKNSSDPASVFMFKRTAPLQWEAQLTFKPTTLASTYLNASDGDWDEFGTQLVIDGETIAVSGVKDEQTYIFIYSSLKQQLLALPAFDGYAPGTIDGLALQGDHLLISASYINSASNSIRVVLVYKRRLNNEWHKQSVLTPQWDSDATGGDVLNLFGGTVAVYNGTMVISENGGPDDDKETGLVYLFKEKDGDWLETMQPVGGRGNKQSKTRYTFDTSGAWNGRLQNLLNIVKTSQASAKKMVDDHQKVAMRLEDWYELTQINTLHVLLTNLLNFGDERVRHIFRLVHHFQEEIESFKKKYKAAAEGEPLFFYEEIYHKDPAVPFERLGLKKAVATFKLRNTLNNLSQDLEIMQRALDQRQRAPDGSMTIQGSALLNADVLATHAMKLARGALMDNRYTRIITYFSQVTKVRVLPYDPDVILIGLPFASVPTRQTQFTGDQSQVPWDFLAIPHEIGHFLFRNGTLKINNNQRATIAQQLVPFKAQIAEEQQAFESGVQGSRPTNWLVNWMEELFCDIYGCIVAGPIYVLGLQDILSDGEPEDLIKDSGHHPIPAIRPFIASQILKAIQDVSIEMRVHGAKPVFYNVVPKLLDENWKAKLVEWDILTPEQDTNDMALSVLSAIVEHDHEEHENHQYDSEHYEFVTTNFETVFNLSMRYVWQMLSDLVDIFYIPDWTETLWSNDVKFDLSELEDKFTQGISKPIESFDKQPNHYVGRYQDNYHEDEKFPPNKRVPENLLDQYLRLWANKGPEGGIHGG
ncbi:MAG: FG-GAP repeat protein [Chloroflexota bacterium]